MRAWLSFQSRAIFNTNICALRKIFKYTLLVSLILLNLVQIDRPIELLHIILKQNYDGWEMKSRNNDVFAYKPRRIRLIPPRGCLAVMCLISLEILSGLPTVDLYQIMTEPGAP